MADVKQLVALLVAVMVFSVPAIAAEQAAGQVSASAQASAQASADAKAKVGKDLRLRMIGEAFGDFVFNVKSVLTFEKKAKLELLKERNEKLRERQKAWLEMKAELLGNFSSNMTAEEKKEAVKAFQAEHRAIIKEHVKATAQIRKLQLKAKAEGNAEFESEAEEAADDMEESEVASGLNLTGELGSLGALIRLEANGEDEDELTEAKAMQMVEKDMRFRASNVSSEVRGNTAYYVVVGSRAESAGAYELEKSYEVWVDAETGVIVSVDMGTRIVAKPGENGASAGASASEVSANAESGASGSAGVSAGTEASAGVGSGSSHSSASTTGGIGVGLG